MALPILSRTWQFQVNQLATAQGTQALTNARLMRMLVNSMLGQGAWTDSSGNPVSSTANWTVSGSSDAAASGMDGVNRWTADNKILWGFNEGGAHSWIVLRQTGIAAKYEVLINCVGSGGGQQNLGMWISPINGFGAANGGNNGSATNRPTATDEIATYYTGSNNTWGGPAGDVNTRLHVLKSDIGNATRIVTCRNGQVVGFWEFDIPASPVTNWASPSIGLLPPGTSTVAPTSTQMNYINVSNVQVVYAKGVSNMTMFLTGEATRPTVSLLGEKQSTANDISGEVPFYPIGLYSATAGNVGRHGVVPDLWFGLGSFADGSTYPNLAPLRQFCQFGVFICPWNQSIPLLL